MITYQDLQRVGTSEKERMAFVRSSISKYQATEFYKTAKAADEYDRRKNPDIRSYTRMLYNMAGRKIPDTYSSNYKVGRGFFPYFILQEVQYLLGNGVTWEKNDTADKLGKDGAEFDTRLQDAAHAALSGGCSYGFWNLDHVDVFNALEFVPLPDEENGSLRSGIRYWQIDTDKPLRATLYEEDGYTDYMWNRRLKDGTEEAGVVLVQKRPYVITSTVTPIDGEAIYHGENYPTFPIVPFWGNKKHQSELVGLQEQIYVYDMVKSGFCNSVEDASYTYWIIKNAPGMDEVDMAKFMERVRRIHAAQIEENGATAEPHQVDVPYQSRAELLDMLEKDIFKDAMAFDPERVASGATTATQIKAAYENLELKCNDFEYCVSAFVKGILKLAGVEDNPTYTRSKNVNVSEEVQTILSTSSIMDEEYITRKILTILGDGDQADKIIDRKIDDETRISRMIPGQEEEEVLEE